jgi:hypothetical protein
MALKSVSMGGNAGKAQPEPSFIVEYQGRLYVTAAVIEYPETGSGLTADQLASAQQVRDMYEAGQASAVAAVPVQSSTVAWGGQSTDPPPPD